MHKKLSPVALKKYGASSFPNQIIKEMQVSDLPWSRGTQYRSPNW
jgi:hypothetical protein